MRGAGLPSMLLRQQGRRPREHLRIVRGIEGELLAAADRGEQHRAALSTFTALSLTSYAPGDVSSSSRRPIRSSHLTAAATPDCLAPRYSAGDQLKFLASGLR
jgi:hypothetical protein